MAQLLQILAATQKCCSLRVTFLLIALIMIFFSYKSYLYPRSQKPESTQADVNLTVREHRGLQSVKLSRMLYRQPQVLTPARKDVLVVTPWLAPIIWEGTFNTDILNEQFSLRNATIGLTVFSIKTYMIFLKQFLQSAEMYFMVGHRVIYYIFTDKPEYVPYLNIQKGRQIIILEVESYYDHWQDISMQRMEMISNFCQERFHQEVDYLVCSDVDMRFSDHVGVEILSSLFGTLHPGYYGLNRTDFPYERRPQSQAHIPKDEGDFYYIGALFGGSVPEVYKLTKACHEAIMVDQANHIEAIWHDESHLNKYLLYHKPSKVLSPEYLWQQQQMDHMHDQEMIFSKIIRRKKLKVLKKNYQLKNWQKSSAAEVENYLES
uniref:Histo-blood group ABO system transferase n=2 Tax=Canis lupus familiaris TaxID=9615 RepID=A0A8P0N9K7_CANLF